MEILIKCRTPEPARSLGSAFTGNDPEGGTLSFDTAGLLVDGKPFYGISGEAHFTRLAPEHRREALLKMKAGGVNIVSTYIFWIHHEEKMGVFDWSGRRELRSFLLDCVYAGLFCILRIGPFNHGEVRNGGLPDWLYGMPFEVRSTDPGFLFYVKRLYTEIARQAEGLLYKDGGPIIGIQLDNEYMHSSAIWEATRATTREYASSSSEGDAYLLALKKLCRETGLDVPFYTCTAWGGAAAPYRECLPLWGGYPYMPWMIDEAHKEHPLSDEYLYRNCKSPECRRYHSYDPKYDPREMPFACCEMGPGMQVAYQYRFTADPRCADALCNVKVGSGCNFVGYYMYCGGTNPTGETIPYLHEEWCPKLSYDYQAPLGEYLQVRDSAKRLRSLHGTLKTFETLLARAGVSLPQEADMITSGNMDTPRAAVRSDGREGLLFLNNFQDHAAMSDKRGLRFVIETENAAYHIPRRDLPPLALDAGESCVIPFGMEVLGALLRYSTAQIVYMLDISGGKHAFCLRPDGMRAEMNFGEYGLLAFSGGDIETKALSLPDGLLNVTVLSRRESMKISLVNINDSPHVLYADADAYEDDGDIVIKSISAETCLRVFPPVVVAGASNAADGIFSLHEMSSQTVELPLSVRRISDTLYTLSVPPVPCQLDDAMIQIRYEGDTAQLFENGRLLADNFNNGTPWEVSLKSLNAPQSTQEVTLRIVPVKEGVIVSRDVMAAVSESAASYRARLVDTAVRPVYACRLSK